MIKITTEYEDGSVSVREFGIGPLLKKLPIFSNYGKTDFANELKESINKKAKSRLDFSKQTGIHESVLRRWENGSLPSDAILRYFYFVSETPEELQYNIEKYIGITKETEGNE